MGYRCVQGAPDLVVEVLSPNTRADDSPGGRKWAIYERYGVPYYWIVDADARAIEMYRLITGAYELLARPTGATMTAAEPFAGLTLTDIWP